MENSFLSRWSKKKLEVDEESPQPNETESEKALESVEDPASDVDKPDSLASLLVSEASDAVKKNALRQLFLSGEFSEVDRLNDYDHDFASVSNLPQAVSDTLRDWINKDEEKELEPEAEPLEMENSGTLNESDEALDLDDRALGNQSAPYPEQK